MNNGTQALVKGREQDPVNHSLIDPLETVDSSQTETKQAKISSNSRNPLKNRILISVGAILAVSVSIFGYHWLQYTSSHETTDDAYVTGDIYPISSQVSGTIQSIPVNDNQEVQQGQLLVQLDPKDYQAVVQQAQASLQSAIRQAKAAQANISLASQTATANSTEAQSAVGNAIATIDSANAAVNQAKTAIADAQAQLAKAQAQAANANVNRDRYQQLYQTGAVTKQQRDNAFTNDQVAEAQLQSAKQDVLDAKAKYQAALDNVDQARAQLADSQGKVQQAQASGQQTQVNRQQYQAAQAQIAAAAAALHQAKINLSYTQITAPVAGQVGNKTAEVGQRVQPGQPLMAVVSDSKWIIANFNETQLDRIQPGETVDIRVDAFPNRLFKGIVNSISSASGSDFSVLPPDNATGNFTKVVQRIPVKITFDPSSIRGYETRIAQGMSVEVTVAVH